MTDLIGKTGTRASVVLYISSAVMLLFSMLLPLMEMACRMQQRKPGTDTVIEMVEWNPYSQAGVVLAGLAVFHFCLGIAADKRGA